MEFVANIFLAAGAFGVTLYCVVLSRRLKRFSDLETGIGGAIAALSRQVDDLTKLLEAATVAAYSSAGSVEETTKRAETAARRLELLIASLHDLPNDEPAPDEALFFRKKVPAE
ncbi:hypothetical protein [Pelagovum sp. HNIBRBA483]|uniref:hypothetical protein n=1 Tax=Pelagovum sp. HNIBRBA483 TaxID=3233341 RepID=UPI0034A34001